MRTENTVEFLPVCPGTVEMKLSKAEALALTAAFECGAREHVVCARSNSTPCAQAAFTVRKWKERHNENPQD